MSCRNGGFRCLEDGAGNCSCEHSQNCTSFPLHMGNAKWNCDLLLNFRGETAFRKSGGDNHSTSSSGNAEKKFSCFAAEAELKLHLDKPLDSSKHKISSHIRKKHIQELLGTALGSKNIG